MCIHSWKELNTRDGTLQEIFIVIYDLVGAHLECLKQKNNKKFGIKV